MKLDAYLKERGLSYGEFGDTLNVTAEAVRLWALGRRIPQGQYMRQIVAVTDGAVRANDFYDLEEAS